MSFLWSLISFIIAISILIGVHEFGHFWVARKCGIKVHRFSIGFGKVLWKRIDKYGTEFAVSIIPLGGYVKMLDERNEPVPPELKSQAFNHKSVLQRALVIAAGPLANFIFAIAVYWIIYMVGIPSVKPVIASITPNSLVAETQLKANTQIVAIDGKKVSDWETINMLLATKIGSDQVEITVSPFGYDNQQSYVVNLNNWHFDPETETAFTSLGINPVQSKVEMTLSKVLENSPASQAGLKVGDEIFQNDKAFSWQQFVQQVNQGKPFAIQIKRNGEIINQQLTPELNDKGKWYVGVSPTFIPIADEYRSELKYDILDALQKGAEKTAQLSVLTLKLIGKLFTGDLGLNNLSGPISIAKGAGMSSSVGLVYFLSFMALISVNLGIMNLFPLPVLDGGHLVFLAVEWLKGSPVSERVQDFCYRIGALLLLVLSAFALVNDFLRL